MTTKTSYPRVKRAKLNLDNFDPEHINFAWSTRVLFAQKKALREAGAIEVRAAIPVIDWWPWHHIELIYR